MRKLQLFIALACLGWTVKAQDSLKTVQLDEVVVTGTKSEIPVEKSGKSIFKLTRQDIEASGSRSVADVLNQVPGVQMDGNFGPLGTNVSYFVRGASSKRTLILIDGVPFNDASGIDQTYDLRLLDLDQVESIEVLKGGLSTLYGSGAAAGVINIQLKKPSNKTLSGNAGIEYGSFNTLSTNASVSGSLENVSYLVNAGYKKSDGFSAAKDESGNSDFDDDGFEGYNILTKVDYRINPNWDLGFTAGYDQFTNDFDAGAFSDSETNYSEYSQIRAGLRPSFKWNGGRVRANIFINKLDRFFESFGSISDFDAKNHQADLVVEQQLIEEIKFIGGINYQRLEYAQMNASTESFNMMDPYLTFLYEKSGFNLQIGSRANIHSEYGSNFVFNINPSYLLEMNSMDIKIFGSYATAFITPSLFQLFGPFGANPELDPEESKTAEIGVASYFDNLTLEAVYFYRNDENLIIYTSQYENANTEIETDGLEFVSSIHLSDQLSIDANYTYTRRLSDDVAYRIPAHKYGANLTYKLMTSLTTSLSYLHTGERRLQYFDNSTFEVVQVNGESFDLFNFSTSYSLNNLTFTGIINNVFDQDYQAIAGFNSVGRNYALGVNYQFN